MKKRAISCASVVLLCAWGYAFGDVTFYGVTGLIKIPAAEVLDSGKVCLGTGYMHDYFTSGSPQATGQYWQWSLFGTVGLFPNFEIGLRMAGVPDLKDPNAGRVFKHYVDRMMSFKYVVMRETSWRPALAVGAQDAVGASKLFHCFYVVATKNAHLPFLDIDAKIHLGYGTDWFDNIPKDARAHRFQGLFGGLEVRLSAFAAVMAEYDAEDFNLGLRLLLGRWANADIYLTEGNRIGGRIGFAFAL